jgi:hypothetical protein
VRSASTLTPSVISPAKSLTRRVETATQAIHNLREVGLLKDRDDEIVEPTPAGLRAVALLT